MEYPYIQKKNDAYFYIWIYASPIFFISSIPYILKFIDL